jgi:hypothetical protein
MKKDCRSIDPDQTDPDQSDLDFNCDLSPTSLGNSSAQETVQEMLQGTNCDKSYDLPPLIPPKPEIVLSRRRSKNRRMELRRAKSAFSLVYRIKEPPEDAIISPPRSRRNRLGRARTLQSLREKKMVPVEDFKKLYSTKTKYDLNASLYNQMQKMAAKMQLLEAENAFLKAKLEQNRRYTD